MTSARTSPPAGAGPRHHQHLVVGTRAKRDVIVLSSSLRRPERAGFVRIVAVVGNVVQALFFSRQRPVLDIHAKKALVIVD